ncbi:hypothetical protein IV203_021605 [Nitzschia inconspicua]|uniref:Uncharacterized protein n=1 Tax=Nitzschia inconspicua TaxID=303405 RepID=A0A9K3K964_9STRA|nr:hypothetical protein IV203_021605 [Nitzschia inconspicua]
MPTSMDEDSFLALGNSSLSTFLSTLLKDEEINKFELVVDNAKPDNNNSFRSLRFVEDTPKCKWYNLVGNDSDPDIRSARRGSKLRSHRSNANRRSTTFRRTVSDPSLCIQMPRRTASPIPVTQKKLIERKTARSESDLLRMPKTLQSPIVEKASLNCTKATRNATWDTAKLKKKNEMVNLFIDLMIEAEDDATEPISPNAAPICFKGEMTLATSCLWENPILSHEKKVLSMPRQPFGEPRRSLAKYSELQKKCS